MDKKELLEGLLYELSALYPISVLCAMYETAINDEDYTFWYINLITRK